MARKSKKTNYNIRLEYIIISGLIVVAWIIACWVEHRNVWMEVYKCII